MPKSGKVKMTYETIRKKLLTKVRNKIHTAADAISWSQEKIHAFFSG